MKKPIPSLSLTAKILSFALISLFLCSLLPVDSLVELEQKYEAYKEKYPVTKINLIFNQPLYAPGDTAFFSAWYMDEQLMTIKGDHILTLDLIDGNGKTVQKIRFKVKNGRGQNQLVLKGDLAPSQYLLVCYTEWMKNFDESWYYKKNIQILSKKRVQTQSVSDNSISFYPEGGHLVNGANCNIMVTGPASTQLVVRSSDNSEVARVSIDSTGLGNFSLIPNATQEYYATSPAGEKKWSLPKVTPDGLSVKLDMKDTCHLRLTLSPNSKWNNQELIILVVTKGKIKVRRKVVINPNETNHLQIPIAEKTDAYHQLFVFSPENELLAERIFLPQTSNSVTVNLRTPLSAAQRQAVSFSFNVTDNAGGLLESESSTMVLQKKLFEDRVIYNSFSLLDLPEVANRIEKINTYSLADVNNFLVTQKWRRIPWKKIIDNQSTTITFPFQSLITLSGQVISKTSGSAPPDSTAVITYLQKNTIGYESYTKNGKFTVPIIFDFWGDDKIFVTLQRKSKNIDNDYEIHITKDSANISDRFISIETALPSAYGEFAFNKRIISKSYSFYGTKQEAVAENLSLNSLLEEEFLGADASIKIADYVLFPTMEDMLHEIVPFVIFQQRGTRKIIKISYRYEKSVKIYEEDPLYIIDGMMCKDTPFFLSIKPENLLTIKVINNPNKLAQLGKLGENGIIFVESRKGNLSNSLIGRNIFPIAGQSKDHQFFEPNYLTTQPSLRVPDLRSTLHWSPNVKLGKAGNDELTFFASDDIGPMSVRVEGLTKDGQPFIAEKTILLEANLKNR